MPNKLKTTGIGSLPFTDPNAAVRFVLESGPDIAFWPQLPRRTAAEKMIPQYAEYMPCVRWDETKKDFVLDISDKYAELEEFYGKYLAEDSSGFEFSENSAAGFYAFIKALETREVPPSLKGQITGPVTFTTGISDPEGRTIYSDPELRDAAVKLLARNACMQVDCLKKTGTGDVVIFADEPVLSAYGSSAYVGISEEDVIGMLSEVFSAISKAGATPGMHVCGNSDWGMAMRSGVKMLNFDAYQYGKTMSLYTEELKHFFDSGGRIAWGIVPTTDAVESETASSLATKLNEALEALKEKGLERNTVLERSLITPSCGAGGLNQKLTEKVFSLLKELKNCFN